MLRCLTVHLGCSVHVFGSAILVLRRCVSVPAWSSAASALELGSKAWIAKFPASCLRFVPFKGVSDAEGCAISADGGSAPALTEVLHATCGAILLATKACEQAKRLRDIVNAVYAYLEPEKGPVSLGGHYDVLKKEMVRWEAYYLRQIAFDVDSVTCKVHDAIETADSVRLGAISATSPRLVSTSFAIASDVGLMLRVWPDESVLADELADYGTEAFAQACICAAKALLTGPQASAGPLSPVLSGAAHNLLNVCQRGVA